MIFKPFLPFFPLDPLYKLYFLLYYILTNYLSNQSEDKWFDMQTGEYIDMTSNASGLRYQDDYSNNYTDRSLVDKAYVDAEIAAIQTAIPRLFKSDFTTGNINNHTIVHNLNSSHLQVTFYIKGIDGSGNVYYYTDNFFTPYFLVDANSINFSVIQNAEYRITITAY